MASIGVTTGTTATSYDPDTGVRRDQMASFLARFVDLLIEEGVMRRVS